MCEKGWLRAADDLGKLIHFVDYQLRYASETLSANVWAATYVLSCLVD